MQGPSYYERLQRVSVETTTVTVMALMTMEFKLVMMSDPQVMEKMTIGGER